jgi:undecaprenyl-phosphate 4-deoxy-4-formamido-L-arabinose transferase
MSLSIFVLIDKFYHPDIPMGWPSLIVAVMVFSGVQLVVLGLVGEYVGRLFLSSNQTPQFVIREIIKVK